MTSTLPPLVQALSGAVGSALASALTYPLDLITTRLQLDSSVNANRRGGVKGGLRLLLFIVCGSKQRRRAGAGWLALYNGLQSDLFATMLSNFFYFYFYSFLRSISTQGLSPSITLPFLRRILAIRQGSQPIRKPHKPSLFEDLVVGFAAGVASRAISTPLNIITLRIQEERADAEDEEDSDRTSAEIPSTSEMIGGSSAENMGTIDIAKLIYKEDGFQGFWKGFATSALLSVNPSVTLAVFQVLRKIVVYSRHRGVVSSGSLGTNLKPMEAFFVAAIANSIASTILYPLILAKKRLQSGAGIAPNATLFGVLRDAHLGEYYPYGGEIIAPAISGSEYRPTKRPSAGRSKSGRHLDPEETFPGKTEGMDGLYQGLQVQVLKGFFNQGVTFLVKGRIEQLVVAAYLRRLGK